MFAKSVEDDKALHAANKTIMIPLLNIKHTMRCKKKTTFVENSSSCKDKGLAPKKKKDEHKFAPQDCVSRVWLLLGCLLLIICVSMGMPLVTHLIMAA